MEHYKEGQYDDDLTVGIDGYDEDFDTGGVDLFDYVGDDESPLARLKSIILSIDWEITDDILLQCNEELRDLEDIWAGNKFNLIYVQALAKISRYIYKEKAAAHPSAIKLLLTFYANLEKIVSDEEMTEREKKNLLRTDIERFEKLKVQIGSAAASAKPSPAKKPHPAVLETDESPVEIEDDFAEAPTSDAIIPPSDEVFGEPGEEDPLLNLKAIVYGIDWEITERDLKNLAREVKRLEKEFITSRVKQIFLQGLGSLGAYINAKRSNAHADVFKLLHSFYTGLEKVVREDLSGQAEKNVLLPEVEKFNTFKALIADTLSPDSLAKSTAEENEDYDESYEEIQPAFSDVPEDVHGFQEDKEATTLEEKASKETVDEYFEEDEDEDEPRPEEEDSQMATEMESRLQGLFDEPEREAVLSLDADTALRGVDVESDADDDSDEEPLPEEDGELSPALATDAPSEEQSPAVFTEKVEEFFQEPQEEAAESQSVGVPGVDVDHEADDDSEEVPLRFEEDGEFAPALSGEGESEEAERGRYPEIEDTLDTFFSEDDEEGVVDEKAANLEELEQQKPVDETTGDIEERLTDFFGESETETVDEVGEDALQGVAVETAEDDDSEETPLPFENGELAPALAAEEDEASALSAEELSDDEMSEPISETDEVEEEFDDLFGEEEEIATDEEEVFDFEEEPGAAEEEALLGVEVETPEDDDTEEEPLALEEDGELAPALGAGGEEEVLSGDEDDDAAESEVGDRFDSFFEAEEEAEGEQGLDVSEEHLPEESEEGEVPQTADLEESLEETLSFDEKPDEEEPAAPLPDFDEDPVEEEAVKPLPSEEDEIMSLLGEEDIEDSLVDTLEEEIPEVSSDEIGAVITDDETVVKAAGSVPSGYPSADELLREFGEIAGGEEGEEITHPEGNEDFIIGIEGGAEEEEVLFEPVDEEIEAYDEFEELEELSDETPILDEAAAKQAALEDDDYDESDFFGTTLLADEPKIKSPEEVEKKVAYEPAAEALEEEEESGYIERPGETRAEDALADLRNCIVSLGLEIDDGILDSLGEEIEKLRVAWLNRPAERTLIQLLSTIAGHIERYRYEADAEANRLLLSVFDKLELSALGKAESSEIQEAILGETSKVLQWQSRLIDRGSAAAGQKAPVPDFEVPETIAETEEKISAGLDDMYKKVDEIGNDILMQKVSTIMKAEMEQLKAAFHDELHELRQELMRRK